MQFVSPAELERYETEQFRLEAEAEAIAIRTEAEELARRQLHKNAKAPNTNKGSRMLSGLGLAVRPPTRARGRPRGRHGRGRGRLGGLVLSSRQLEDDVREELVDSEPVTTNRQTERTGKPILTSPGLMRSAFVANSALPVSSLPRRLSTSLPWQKHTELLVLEDQVDQALASHDAKPVTNVPVHLRDSLIPAVEVEGENINTDHPCTRPHRMGSIVSSEHPSVTPALSPSTDKFSLAGTRAVPLPTQASSPSIAPGTKPDDMFSQTPLFFDRSSIAASDSDDTIPAQPPPPHHEPNNDVNNDTMHMHTAQPDRHSLEYDNNDDDADADGAEEYVVEAIVEHFQEDGKNYYLVKWDGYEDSHDWLPEEDLEGAADLVAEYNERIGWRNKKVRMR